MSHRLVGVLGEHDATLRDLSSTVSGQARDDNGVDDA